VPNAMYSKTSVLNLFSGRPGKPSSLAGELQCLGLRCENVDKLLGGDNMDVLCDMAWGFWLSRLGCNHFIGFAGQPPCGTFSPSRSNPPGPRPLRSAEHVAGLPSTQLTEAEVLELRTANVLCDRALEGAETAYDAGNGGFLENPLPVEGHASFFLLPRAVAFMQRTGVKVAIFDMCMLGGDSTHPTQIVYWYIDLSKLHGQRCNHPPRQWEDNDTQRGRVYYMAPHQRVVRRKIGRAWASAAAADFPLRLNQALALAFVLSVRATVGRRSDIIVEKEESDLD
jgi:hypothetical protein